MLRVCACSGSALVSCVKALLLIGFLSLLGLNAPPAQAGYYSTTLLSNGTSYASNGPAEGSPYEYDLWANYADFYSDDFLTISDVNACYGYVEFQFDWQPDNANDPPPDSVIVREDQDAWWEDDLPFGDCDDDAGDPQQLSFGDDGSCYGESKGTYYDIIDGGQSFTLSFAPVAETNTGDGSAGVDCDVSVYPVSVALSFSGTTKDSSGTNNILVGQNCTPSLNLPGLPSAITVGWPAWTVSGHTFQSFDINATDQSTGQATPYPNPFPPLILPTFYVPPTFFWKDVNIYGHPETVQGTAALYSDPAGGLSQNPVLPAGAYVGTVTASKTVQVWQPDEYDTPTRGSVFIANPQLGTIGLDLDHSQVVSNDPSGNSDGFDMAIAVATPDFFTQNQTAFGLWAFAQTCQFNNTAGGNLTQMASPELDSSFPYNTSGNIPNGIPGVPFDANLRPSGHATYQLFHDSPSMSWRNPIIFYDTAFAFDNRFNMYVMYQPPDAGNGVNWVPLDMYQWGYSVNMTRPDRDAPWSPAALGSVVYYGKTQSPDYPSWADKFPP